MTGGFKAISHRASAILLRLSCLLFFLAAIGASVSMEALAASTGCEAIESGFGSGFVAKYDSNDPEYGELYLNNLTLHEGETLHYTVTSVGSLNAAPEYGGGFGIYSGGGSNIHEEVWATSGNELNVSSSFVVPETRSDYIVFAWGAFGMEAPETEVTATVYCEADEAAPKITSISPASTPAILTFSPASGSLPEAMAGEEYNQTITAMGGIGDVFYTLEAGTLPPGLHLDLATGKLSGRPDANSEDTYNFTVRATDSHNNIATASYRLVVGEPAITVADKSQSVPAGTKVAYLFLETGATGGPFTGAEMVFAEPSQAGATSVVYGEFAQSGTATGPLGWYLKFEPASGYSGKVRVGYRLKSALGVSNTGVVNYTIGFDTATVVQETQALVRDFVRTRQSLIASTIKVPGLIERRRMMDGADPVTMRLSPSGGGLALGFATSLAQMAAALDGPLGTASAPALPFNLWFDGALMAHNRDENDGRWGTFGMLSAGADYLLNDKALIGFSVHYDRMTDPIDADGKLTGNGWLAGPYASFELGTGVYWDTSLLYGGSANDIDTGVWNGDFDTRRWLFDTSVSGQWRLGEATTLTPKLRAVYLNEEVKDFSVANSAEEEVDIGGLTSEQLRVSLGAEVAHQFMLDNGSIFTPKLAVNLGVAGLDGSGAFGSVAGGINYRTPGAWTFDGGLLFNIEDDDRISLGAKASLSAGF